MEYLIGAVLAPALLVALARAGLGHSRNFYPLILVSVAQYYSLFAAIASAPGNVQLFEAAAAAAFISLAVIGFRTNLWLVAAALAGHGAFDMVHHALVTNPGVPAWWPGFCMAFDVVAGAMLAVLLLKHPQSATLWRAGGDTQTGSLTPLQ